MRKPLFFILLISLFILNQAFVASRMTTAHSVENESGELQEDTSAVALFEKYISDTYSRVFPDSALSFKVYRFAVIGQYNLDRRGKLIRPELISVIDFSLSSFEERMYIIDMRDSTLTKKTLVAHGMRSGTIEPRYFSNSSGSKKSSIGFYITGETYNGKHKYSLKLDGQDPYYNTNARNRGVVFHGADYVSHDYIERNGRLGRSFGCPAIPRDENREIVDLLTGGTCVFIYAENQRYVNSCRHLNVETAAEHFSHYKGVIALRMSKRDSSNS